MRTVRRICTLAIGFVFFIAGILKLMDPLGASLIVEEYLKFLHLQFLAPASYAAGLVCSMAETVLGAILLTGIWRAVAGQLTLALLSFFTLLTLALFVVNPPFDCGCFGQAIHLTHGQSLVKNLILLGLWAVAFIPFGQDCQVRKVKYVSFIVTTISVVLFALYSSLSIPLADFTRFKPGEDIFEDETGSALPIFDAEGEYRDSLLASGNLMVVTVFDAESINDWESVSDFITSASAGGFSPFILVSSCPEDIDALGLSPIVLEHLFFADHKTLLTVNRSNGGVVWISDGKIIKKWSSRLYPEQDDLVALASTDPIEAIISTNSPQRLKLQGFLLYVFAVMLLL